MDGRHASGESWLLPQLVQGMFSVEGGAAAARIKVGADVLPWWPSSGCYVLIERGMAPAWDLVAMPGVGGAWWCSTARPDAQFAAANEVAEAELVRDELQLTYCFLDDDPVVVAKRLRPALAKRWADPTIVPVVAAPFYPVGGREVDRHLP